MVRILLVAVVLGLGIPHAALGQDSAKPKSPLYDLTAMNESHKAAQQPVPIDDAAQRAKLEQEKLGILRAMLTTKDLQKIYVGNAAVFLCEAATGLPIHRKTKQPFNPFIGVNEDESPLQSFWVAETEESGVCEFEGVPSGKYRLVAQSWSGTKGFSGFDTNDKPSAFLVLHGTAEDLTVKAGHQTIGYVRQLGNHTLRIVPDPAAPHDFLFISLRPTLGDGILGPYGWGKQFCTHTVGLTQMEVPFVTIVGLPENSGVSVGLVNYDNSVGLGAANFKPGQREGTVRIIAGWSNGHKDPPPELAELTNHLADEAIKLADLVDLTEGQKLAKQTFPGKSLHDQLAGAELLAADNNRMVKVPGLGERRLADVLAAYAYINMRKWKR